MAKIKIFALGGLGENGKNMYVVEVNQHIFLPFSPSPPSAKILIFAICIFLSIYFNIISSIDYNTYLLFLQMNYYVLFLFLVIFL